MKILSAVQIRDWDTFTIEKEPISSCDLMERAVARLLPSFLYAISQNQTVNIFCGKGNNGGDGLVLARLLHFRKIPVHVFIIQYTSKGKPEFEANLQRLSSLSVPISSITHIDAIQEIPKNSVVVDAILGSGLNSVLEGLLKEVVCKLNKIKAKKIAIDIPTGLFPHEALLDGAEVFQADHTFTFQVPKLNFMLPETGKFVGALEVIDIGLHPQYLNLIRSEHTYLTMGFIQQRLKLRSHFGHKGTYGHGLLLVGGKGTYGAGILSCKAFMRSGAGKLTAVVPENALAIYHTSCPEVMFVGHGISHLSGRIDKESYAAIGIGPGIGTDLATKHFLRHFLDQKPSNLVFDANALNMMAAHDDLLEILPAGSILTPHFKEFERMAGKVVSDYDRLHKAQEFALKYDIVLVLKGAHTFITNGKESFFNSTGNVGMATAGSGDVLTGIITGIRCQGYSALDAALVGVYLHGMAGDLALEQQSYESLIASDIIRALGLAFNKMSGKK
jgi:hydroxyethylthiazole kinase-like uncharacterized protein yjeF